MPKFPSSSTLRAERIASARSCTFAMRESVCRVLISIGHQRAVIWLLWTVNCLRDDLRERLPQLP
jgi:hypothetical protein